GIDTAEVRAGISGEIDCSWPLSPSEHRVLRAAATVQRRSGAALTIHPGRSQKAPMEIVRLLDRAGADLSRTVMGHLELRLVELASYVEIARAGCYVELDLFGHESSYYPLSDLDMPNDGRRIELVTRLADAGYLERLLVSQDICTKHRLSAFGGHGYGHLLKSVLPRMRAAGWRDSDLNTLVGVNPAKMLASGHGRGEWKPHDLTVAR